MKVLLQTAVLFKVVLAGVVSHLLLKLAQPLLHLDELFSSFRRNLKDGLIGIGQADLAQITKRGTSSPLNTAAVVLHPTSDDLDEGCFASSITPDQGDLFVPVKAKGATFEDDFAREFFMDGVDRKKHELLF
jgi:hypothetical protein